MSGMGFLRTLRQAVITALVIIILLVVAAAVYLLFFSPRHNFTNTTAAAANGQPALFAPTAPAENAKEGVAIQAIPPTVAAGTEMSVVATTNATSRCTIKVDPSSARQNDPDLAPQTADDYGTVSWNWRVSPSAPLGSQTLTITCVYHGRTGVVAGTYQVSR